MEVMRPSRTERSRGERRLAGEAGIRITASACCGSPCSCQLACRDAAELAPGTEELTEPILVRWKELLADLKKRKRTMTCEDSLIAATVLFRGHSLATHNKRHFEPAGADVIDPLA
jgi:hypothetical protein